MSFIDRVRDWLAGNPPTWSPAPRAEGTARAPGLQPWQRSDFASPAWLAARWQIGERLYASMGRVVVENVQSHISAIASANARREAVYDGHTVDPVGLRVDGSWCRDTNRALWWYLRRQGYSEAQLEPIARVEREGAVSREALALALRVAYESMPMGPVVFPDGDATVLPPWCSTIPAPPSEQAAVVVVEPWRAVLGGTETIPDPPTDPVQPPPPGSDVVLIPGGTGPARGYQEMRELERRVTLALSPEAERASLARAGALAAAGAALVAVSFLLAALITRAVSRGAR